MRRKAYSRILVSATILTLFATTLAPDVILPGPPFNPWQSARVASFEARVFNAITWPPQVVARAAGIWIDSHSAQLWPSGWPAFAAFALRINLIAVPFWSLFGILIFELASAGRRIARRARTDRKTAVPAE
jgi:hypothetical protein